MNENSARGTDLEESETVTNDEIREFLEGIWATEGDGTAPTIDFHHDRMPDGLGFYPVEDWEFEHDFSEDCSDIWDVARIAEERGLVECYQTNAHGDIAGRLTAAGRHWLDHTQKPAGAEVVAVSE